jgi:L-lactate dehydrogenase (cytochrome)
MSAAPASDAAAAFPPAAADGTRGPQSVAEYEAAARRVLPRVLYDFVAGGAADEVTRRRNVAGFDEWWLRSRSFRSASAPSLATELAGRPSRLPLLLAPTGASGLLWPEGEAETARAAAEAGVVMQVSAGSILTMEAIAAAAPGPKWLQLFLYKDRGLTREFLQRARDSGYEAVVVTTDAPVHGRRERDRRNGFTIDPRLRPQALLDLAAHPRWWLRMIGQPRFALGNFAGRATGGMLGMAQYIASVLDPDATWEDFSWLRAEWSGPLVIKGVLTAEDAREAVARGADMVQVSNHGGRQLDGALAAVDALPALAEACDGRVPVLLDGGICRGTQVLKARALGATACAIGRGHLWGLAVRGRAGVAHIMRILGDEMTNAMTIGGWRSLAELDRRAVTRLPGTERHKGGDRHG